MFILGWIRLIFFLLWIVFFCCFGVFFFLIPGNLCDGHLFGYWIFLHSYKSSWALFWDAVRLLGHGLTLSGHCFLMSGDSGQCSGAPYFSLLKEDLSEHPTQCPRSCEFFKFDWWEQALFPALREHQALFWATLLESSFPGLCSFPHMPVSPDQSFVEYFWGGGLPFAGLQGSCPVKLSSFLYSLS